MKKLSLKMLFIFMCIFTTYNVVDAATLEIGNDSTNAGVKNRSVSVELKDNDLSEYSKISFELTISGTAYAEINNFSGKTGTGLTFSSEGTPTTYIIEGKTTGSLTATTIGTITYSTTEDLVTDFKITPTNVKFYKKDGTEIIAGSEGTKIKEGTITYTRPKSNAALLTSLTVNQGELKPAFKSEINEYTVVVKDTINQIRISAESSPGSTKQGTGLKQLNMGENNFEIVVTAEDGTTTNKYILTVVRGEVAEPSPYLKKLDINNIGVELSPEFDSKNNKYTAKIGKDIDKLDIIYEREDSLAEVTIEGNENLIVGENKITITVVSSNEVDKQIYEITVIKEDDEKKDEVPVEKEEPPIVKKKNNIWLIVIIVIVILAIVSGVAFLLFRKKKPTKKENITVKESEKETIEKSENIDENIKDTNKEESNLYNTFEESVTDILKGELFDDDKTQKFDRDAFMNKVNHKDESEDDKTKEFNFKDFE